MVHLPQSEPSVQSGAADNKADYRSLIVALMMQLEGLCFMGGNFWLRNNLLELFNPSQTMTCTIRA